MGDLLNKAVELTGVGGIGWSKVYLTITILVLLVVFAIIAGVIIYFVIRHLQFKLKIVIFKRVAGRFQIVDSDKARPLLISNAGDYVIYLRKKKKTLPFPSIQSEKNAYWYFISDDGEWFNFGPGDFDEDRRELGAYFLDKEMRYARTSLQSIAKERYDKVGFWQKYGGLIAYITLILVTAIGFWLIIGKMLDVVNASKQAVLVAGDVLETTKQVIGALDSLKSGGSGII